VVKAKDRSIRTRIGSSPVVGECDFNSLTSLLATEFEFLAGAELLCRRKHCKDPSEGETPVPGKAKREGHALSSEGSVGQSFSLSHRPPTMPFTGPDRSSPTIFFIFKSVH